MSGMRRQEGRDEADKALDALIGVQRHVDVAGLDMLERRRRDVGVHDQHLGLGFEHCGDRAFG